MADPQLLVALEARLDKFEKALKQAGVLSEQAVRDIEAKFAGMEITPGKIAGGTALGTGIARGVERALDAFIEKITEAIELMNRLNDVIERTGITAEQFQRIGFVGRTAGVDDKTILRDVETLATKFDEMNFRQTELGRILDQNNIKYKEGGKVVSDTNKQWEIAAQLVSRAVGPAQLAEVEKLLGVSREWTNELKKGADALRATQARAPIEDLEKARAHMAALQQLARDIKADFGDWSVPLITLVLPTLQAISQFLVGITATLAQITKGGVLENFAKNIDEAMQKVAAAVERAVTAANTLRITINKPGPGLNLAPEGTKDAIDKQIDALEKHIAVMKADAAAVGLSASAQEQFRVIALLTEAAMRAGVAVTDELAEKFVQLSERAGAAKERLEELRATQAELNAASKEFGSALADAFKEAVLQGKKLDEVLRNLANRMASRAIDKLFDLFFGTRAGQGTSIINQLLGLTARQAGGPLRAGQAAIVGESGPELFVPKSGGMVIPNSVLRSGSGGGVEVRIINNTGQPVAEQERQGPNGRMLEITVGRMVRETINTDLFQGGDIDRAMRARFGLIPRLA